MDHLKVFLITLLSTTCLISLSNGRRNKPLPFTCPQEIEGGNDPKEVEKIKRQLNQDDYLQYRAALALVPCTATAQKAFLEKDLNTEFTVAVAFIYDKSMEDLKYWLEEKFVAKSYENPIRDAVSEKCGTHLVSDHYGTYNRISGDQLFNILCNNDCSTSAQIVPHYGAKRAKRSESNLVTKRDSGYTLPYVPETNSYNAPPQHVDHAYVPIVSHPHAQYPHVAPSYDYHPTEYHYKPKEEKFDDAPKIVYGWVSRTRSIQKCEGENKELCDDLVRQNNVVQCNIPRFSDCDSEWRDCIDESEAFLIEADFYGQCKKEEGINLTQEVRTLAGDCFKNRRCNEPDGLGTSLDESEQTFVGFRKRGECSGNCTNDDIGLEQDLRTLASQRYKRQISGLPENALNNCFNCLINRSVKQFVGKSRNGDRKLFSDIMNKYGGPDSKRVKRSNFAQIEKDENMITAEDRSSSKSIFENE